MKNKIIKLISKIIISSIIFVILVNTNFFGKVELDFFEIMIFTMFFVISGIIIGISSLLIDILFYLLKRKKYEKSRKER